jgi:hypothetical protein
MNTKSQGVSKFFVFTIAMFAVVILYAVSDRAVANVSYFEDRETVLSKFGAGKISDAGQQEKIGRLREKEHHILSNGYSLVWDPSTIEVAMTPGLNSWELTGVDEPFVMFESGLYKMWYQGITKHPSNERLDINALGYATSTDGVNWTNRQLVYGPVSYYHHMGSPHLLKEGGLYRMWFWNHYEVIAGDWSGYIAHITSPDGINWGNEQKVLSAQGQTEDQGDGYNIKSQCVLEEGGYYYMWYSVQDHPARGVAGPSKIWIAMSLDGIVWGIRQLALPYVPGTWEDNIWRPHVVRNPYGDGYIMYYAQYRESGIGRATSLNRINWTDREQILTSGTSPFFFMDPSGIPYLYFSQDGNILRMTAEITIPPSQYVLNISNTTGGTTDPPPGDHMYSEDAEAIVTALPDSGYSFRHWTGDASGSANPITLMMDSDKSIRAHFTKDIAVYTLSIKSGGGGTTDPAPGIYSHDAGTAVTVTAVPENQHRFSHWTGDVDSAENPILIHMDSDLTVKANFIRQHTLTLSAEGGGTTYPPPGNHSYDRGAEVLIVAFPDTHCRFTGWSGAVSGLANPKTVAMNGDKSVKAGFKRIVYAPLNFTGQKVMNRSLSQVEYINVLTWLANPNNQNIVKYKIYRMDHGVPSLLVELNAETSEFWERNVPKDISYTYAIAAVDDKGEQGILASITVQ